MQIKYNHETNQRLDVYLANQLELPRNQIQRLIKSKLVSVNDKTVKSNHQLKLDDVINIDEHLEISGQANIKDITKYFIHDEADFLIINKPAGLTVHPPNPEHVNNALIPTEQTLIDLLVAYYPQIKTVGDDPSRPGIVHRLDKDVSGLLIIAKTQKWFEKIKNQFMERAVKKTYEAVVYGKINNESGVIDFPIQRSRQDGSKMAALPKGSENGREAITKYTVLKTFKSYTHLQLNPLTGRSHQLRVHCKAIDHPIVGDIKYAKHKNVKTDYNQLGQIWLHAKQIEFTDPTGATVSFCAPLPEKLTSWL